MENGEWRFFSISIQQISGIFRKPQKVVDTFFYAVN